MRRHALLIARLLILVALATSTALLIDYARTVPTFCAPGSGCDAVRLSAFGYVAGLPLLPIAGVVGFLLLALLGAKPHWPAFAAGAVLSAIVGAALLVVQIAVVGALCWLCAIVDVSAILVGIFAVIGWRVEPATQIPRPLWLALAMTAIVLPGSFMKVRPMPPLPENVAALQRPGVLTIVDIADFECEHCRHAHPDLRAVEQLSGATLVRKTYPLPFHTHARHASRAYVCAREQGRGEQMADLLFAIEPLLFRQDALRAAAQTTGLDIARYDECFSSGRAERLVRADMAFVSAAGFRGLPTVFIGGELLIGARPRAEYEAAAARATGRASSDRGWMWVLMAAVWCAVMIGLSARMARRTRS